jgi:TonB family protein
MRDAVAEVLLERKALPSGGGVGLAASLILHALVVVAVFAGARERPGKPPPVLTVRFAPAAAPAAVPAAPAAAPSAPAAPAAQMEPAAPPQPKPAAVPPKKVETSKKAEPAKKGQKPVETGLFGQNPKAPTAVEEAPAPSAPAAAGGGGISGASAVPGIGTAGVTGLEGGDFPYTVYIDRMITLIGQRWFRPEANRTMLTQIYFVIERDGRIRDARVERGSGNAAFDRAALRAVLETSPLPPLPFGYRGTWLGVHLSFH